MPAKVRARVLKEGLQRRDIEACQTLAPLRADVIEDRQHACQRLAAAGRRAEQQIFAGRNDRPGQALPRRGRAKALAEPGTDTCRRSVERRIFRCEWRAAEIGGPSHARGSPNAVLAGTHFSGTSGNCAYHREMRSGHDPPSNSRVGDGKRNRSTKKSLWTAVPTPSDAKCSAPRQN